MGSATMLLPLDAARLTLGIVFGYFLRRDDAHVYRWC